MTPIAGVAVRPYDLALVRPWRTAAGTVCRRRGVIVVLTDHDGRIGLGDCPARLPDQDGGGRQATALLSTARFLVGADPEMVAPGELLADPLARAGLDGALLDLAARQRGLPLRRLLDAAAPSRVAVNRVGGGGAGLPSLPEGGVVKLKVGLRPWREEATWLRDLAVPSGVTLRLDANRAWAWDEARAMLAALDGLAVEAVEEPLRTPDPIRLAALQAETPISLALDESLEDLGLETILATRPVRRLVLKPALLGGVRPTLALAALARKAGFDLVVTSYLDSAVGVTAAAHLAAAIDPAACLAHGLATSEWLAADVALAPVVAGGHLDLGEHHGLGISLCL